MMPESRAADPRATLDSASVLGLCVWVGLLTGLMEVALRSVQSQVLGIRIWLSADLVWMAPLADVVIFAALGLVLTALHKLWPRVVSPTVLAAVLAFTAIVGPLLHLARIHQVASLLLAAGVAVQAGRMLAPHLATIRRLAAKSAVWMVLLVVAMAGAVRGAAWLGERQRIEALAEPESGSPNVLLIILDTVRAKSMSLYGYEHRTTPIIDSIAAGGVTFEQTWSTSPWTLPAHASMFTGHYPHELSTTLLTPLDDEYPTLAERFTERGYGTAGFIGNLLFTTRWSGLDRGFIHYSDYPTSIGMVVASSWLARIIKNGLGGFPKLKAKDARTVNREFIRWLDRQDGDRPFFVFLNFMDAHAPYLPPDPYDGMFGPKRDGVAMADPSEHEHWTESGIEAERAAYDGALAYLDAQLGVLFVELDDRGALENTIIIICSDHGEQFGEHGLMDHGNSMYRPLLRVPLVVVWPDHVPVGERALSPVSLRDLPASIAALAWGEPELFPGRSFRALRTGTRAPTTAPSPVLSEVKEGVRTSPWLPLARGPMKSLVLDGFHYIRNGDGVEELYDIELDPEEADDLGPLPRSEAILERMRAEVASLTSEPLPGRNEPVEERAPQ
jgi:arylsulfatase A-like enzyme